MNKQVLIGDIGGTNVRFALVRSNVPGFSKQKTFKGTDYVSVENAIKHYLEEYELPTPNAIYLAVAGPVRGDKVNVTNNNWTISAKKLRQDFNIDNVQLINDFEAIAYSLPFLSHDDVITVGDVKPQTLDNEHYTVGVIGPGTGLGAAGLRKFCEHPIPIVGEAAHSGFAPETKEQIELLMVLRKQFNRVSIERLVSGSGLENLYWGLTQIHGKECIQLCAHEIMESCINKSNPLAHNAVDIFFQILGQFAGDFALALGAKDGIYIAGGIVQRYPQLLANSQFRTRFEAKGRHQTLMQHIPTQLIMHRQPGLLGAACAAQNQFLSHST